VYLKVRKHPSPVLPSYDLGSENGPHEKRKSKGKNQKVCAAASMAMMDQLPQSSFGVMIHPSARDQRIQRSPI
jgi:hypothetical protein